MLRYYVSIRPLADCYYPVKITRGVAFTLAEVDPRASKREMLDSSLPLLEPWEIEAARQAYGQPPLGENMDRFFLEGQVMPYVPPYLRMPAAPAIQNPDLSTAGGREAYMAALEWLDLEILVADAYAQVS